jgi:hypothetical protein
MHRPPATADQIDMKIQLDRIVNMAAVSTGSKPVAFQPAASQQRRRAAAAGMFYTGASGLA